MIKLFPLQFHDGSMLPHAMDDMRDLALAPHTDAIGATFTGTKHNDTQDGTADDDTFNYWQGGNDTLNGEGGDDTFVFKGKFNAFDHVDGGDGFDTLILQGDYTGMQAAWNASTLTNVEMIQLLPGKGYNIGLGDGNVGPTLSIDAHTLTATEKVSLSALAVSTGALHVWTGAGDDSIFTGGGNDTITAGAGDDLVSPGAGTDSIDGNTGNDTILFQGTFDASDAVDGGPGNDTMTVTFAGDTNVTLTANSLKNVETLNFEAANGGGAVQSFGVTESDANVAANATLHVNAVDNTDASTRLVFDGSGETNGQFDFHGGRADDVLVGGSQSDTFHLEAGGDDDALGQDGDDVIYGGPAVDANDTIAGGDGNDTLYLNGGYNLAFANGSIQSIEKIVLAAHFSYTLSTADGNVAAGQVMIVQAAAHGAGDVTFDGSAEMDGSFLLIGGNADDTLTGGAQTDTFDISKGGEDTVHGGGNSDVIFGGAAVTIGDHLDGGDGNDTLELNGNYNILWTAGELTSIENIVLAPGSNYALTFSNAIAAGTQIEIDGSGLDAAHSVSLDAHSNPGASFVLLGGDGDDQLRTSDTQSTANGYGGNDLIYGGADKDTLYGGDGNDIIFGNGGGDTITPGAGKDEIDYGGPGPSLGTAYDTIVGFDANDDRIGANSSHTISGINHEVHGGTLDQANFDSDLAAAIGHHALAKNHAVLFAPDSGDFAGDLFLIVDCNGKAGYQAAQDQVFLLSDALHLNHLGADNFLIT